LSHFFFGFSKARNLGIFLRDNPLKNTLSQGCYGVVTRLFV